MIYAMVGNLSSRTPSPKVNPYRSYSTTTSPYFLRFQACL